MRGAGAMRFGCRMQRPQSFLLKLSRAISGRCGIRVHGKQLEQVAEKISSLDAVYSVSAVSGIQDLEILCATKTLEETVELLDVTLPAIKGIKSITPAISSKVYKFQTDWAPLGND